ncbi:hypothetical protein [Roseomonas sp. BN140053]|uniref:hypothetical protein n=1 Tax=Roseomonas sp. BN140053 TaxID=3391898 RepID=UPI0039E867A0
MARIAELAGKGSSPGRITREVDTIVSGWLAGAEVDRAEVKERLEDMRDQLAAGVEDAREQLDGTDQSDKAAVKHGTLSLAALEAARDALSAAHSAL